MWAQLIAGAAIAVAAAVSTGGCHDAPSSNKAQCVDNTQCTAQRRCAFGYCVAPGVNSATVHLALSPQTGSNLAAQQAADVGLSAGPSFDLTLAPSAVITGSVHFSSGPLANVEGTLTAQAEGEIEGLPHVFSGKSSGGEGFRITLLRGREYVVTFRPDNSEHPPHTFVWDTTVTQADSEQEIILPLEETARIAGFIGWEQEAAEDATVTAYSKSGVRLTQTTTGWRGDFGLALPPLTDKVWLRIRGHEDQAQFADVRTDLMDVSEAVKIPLRAPWARFEVQLGVLGLRPGEGPEPVEGASLTLQMEEDYDGLTRIEDKVTGVTRSSGTATLSILPGRYHVLVTPPSGSPFATDNRIVLELNEQSGSVDIELPLRLALDGAVLDDQGHLVSGQIEATRRADAATTERPLPVPSTSFKTDLVDGTFALLVDPGEYDLKYTPLAKSQAPPAWKLGLKAEGPQKIEFQLPAPGVVAIRVLDEHGEPVPDVQVRALMNGGSAGLRALSTGFSDDHGRVSLPVPFE